MSALREIQQRFADSLIDCDPSMLLTLLAGQRAEADGRFGIHSNHVYVSLIDALAAVYPVVQRLLGSNCFRQVARRYVSAHPSRTGDLQAFGDQFEGHLAVTPELSGLPYLADVARLEWHWHQVFHAPWPGAAVCMAWLAEQSEESLAALKLSLHPAARLTSSSYPVLRIWQANLESDADPAEVSLDEGGVLILTYRPRTQVELHELSAGEFGFLSAIDQGMNLQLAFESAQRLETGFDLAACLARHCRNGLLRYPTRLGLVPLSGC